MTHNLTADDFTASTTGNRILTRPLAGEQPARSILPAGTYTQQTAFELEREHIFASGWVWAGYLHWLANVGNVVPVSVADRPVLLVRGEDGEVRAFHNACRHRGMILTEEPIEVTRRIQCPYHCWSYKLDGALAAAPFFTRERQGRLSGAEQAHLGLLPVPSATWAGMVFVHLGTPEQSFEELIEPLASRWSHIDFSRLHLAGEREFDLGVNWKLVVENFLDFYHLPFVHPQVGPVTASLDVDDLVLSDDVFGGSYPRGAEGKAKKTEDQLPRIGDVADSLAGRQDIFCLFPNALVFLEADWFQVIAFEARGVTRTVEHMSVFVDSDAAKPRYAQSVQSLLDVLFEVNEQDIPFLNKLQAGRHSSGADHNSLVPSWDQVTALFQQTVATRLAAVSDG